MKTRKFLVLILELFFSFSAHSQIIKGHVLTADNEPVPYVHIFVQETQTGVVSDEKGFYYLRLDLAGEYELKVSCLGYKNRSIPVVVREKEELELNILLEISSTELESVTVKASQKDPAYAIIQNAIDHKKNYLKSINSYKTEVYVKASEIIEKNARRKKAAVKEQNAMSDDPFEAEKRKNQALMNNLNLVEMQLTLNYEYPKKYKEKRTAYKKYGTSAGLFLPRFGETDFNFYRNRVHLREISESPMISPISTTAILSYKFRLIESKKENGILVHKIKITPRKSGNSTCSGFIYINEKFWNINRLDLNLYKGGLKLYDAFRLKQNHEMLPDSSWIPYRQEFIYKSKQGRFKLFKGNTTLYYSDFLLNYKFPEKFFNNEISLTTRNAYKKDSLYWDNSRPEPLTCAERKMISLRDSVSAIVNSKSYKDSVDKAYNKIGLLEIFWDGVGFQNHIKKTHWYFSSLPSLIDYHIVGSWRAGPYVSYYKGWENGKAMRTYAQASYGFRNKDYNGGFRYWMRYAPHRSGEFQIGLKKGFESINSFDAYLNQVNPANYTLNKSWFTGHKIELFNGFYFGTKVNFDKRESIDSYKSDRVFEDLFLNDNPPPIFDPYQAFISQIELSYTPQQRYMTEPNRKIVLGSKYPTFSFSHRKGWKNIFSSDIDFDYLEFEIKQDIVLGTFGHSKYRLLAGDFVSTKELKFLDFKRFRQSDPFLYSNPMHSFQVLDTAFHTTNLFIEFHHIHHFNGALINNIPFIKKTGIRLVAGGGFLWVKDINFRHEEVFAGLERVFKIGARRRLRLGVFGVLANGNYTQPKEAFKISFDIIDTWKKNWNF